MRLEDFNNITKNAHDEMDNRRFLKGLEYGATREDAFVKYRSRAELLGLPMSVFVAVELAPYVQFITDILSPDKPRPPRSKALRMLGDFQIYLDLLRGVMEEEYGSVCDKDDG